MLGTLTLVIAVLGYRAAPIDSSVAEKFIFSLGSGLLCCMIAPPLLIFIKSLVPLSLMTLTLIVLLALVGPLCPAALAYIRRSIKSGLKVPRCNTQSLIVALLLSYVVVEYAALVGLGVMNVASGWDAVDTWLRFASKTLHGLESAGEFRLYWRTHPPLVPLIAAYTGGISREIGVNLMPITWMIPVLISFLAILRAGQMFGIDRVPRLLSGLLFLSSPLLQNHMVVYGYSELFFMSSFFCGHLCLFLGLSRGKMHFAVMGALLLFLCCLVKNTAFYIVAISTLVAFTSALPIRRRYWKRYFYLFAGASIIALLVIMSWGAYSGYHSVQIGTDNNWHASISGRVYAFSSLNFVEPARNIFYALYFNQSFGVLGIFAFFSAILWRPRVIVDAGLAKDAAVYFGGLLLVVSLSLFSSQLSDYGSMVGAPESDTGLSRHMLVLIPLICVVAMSSFIKFPNR